MTLCVMRESIQEKTPSSWKKPRMSTCQVTWNLLSGCVLSLMVLTSCTASPHLIIYQANQESIDLREWPVGYTEPPLHGHPQTLPPETMESILRSLYYRESMLFSFLMGTPKHLFTDYQITRLAETMSKAFGQALPQEVVAFRVRTDADSSRFTSGFSFIQDAELHVVLETIKMPDFQNKNITSQPNTLRTELVPQSGQRLFSTKADQKGTMSNWVVIQLGSPKGNIKL